MSKPIILFAVLLICIQGSICQTNQQPSWKRVKFSSCSVLVPSSFDETSLRGIDSLVKRYEGPNNESITIDMGLYSGKPDSQDRVYKKQTIKGRKWKGLFIEYDQKELNNSGEVKFWGLFIKNIYTRGVGLSVTFRSKETEFRNIALKVSRSIRCK